MPDRWTRFKAGFGYSKGAINAWFDLLDAATKRLSAARGGLGELNGMLAQADPLRRTMDRLWVRLRVLAEEVVTCRVALGDAETKDAKLAAIKDARAVERGATALMEEVQRFYVQVGTANPINTAGAGQLRVSVGLILDELAWDKIEDDAEAKVLLALRYNLPDGLAGEWTTKSLGRLHAILKTIPDHHVAGNDRLDTIERGDTPDTNMGAYYSQDNRVFICAFDPDQKNEMVFEQDGVDDDANKLTGNEADKFNHTTTHEVGHAVEHAGHIMTVRLGGPALDDAQGGWAYKTLRDVAAHLTTAAPKDGASLMASYPTAPPLVLHQLVYHLSHAENVDPVSIAAGLFAGAREALAYYAVCDRAALLGAAALDEAWLKRAELRQENLVGAELVEAIERWLVSARTGVMENFSGRLGRSVGGRRSIAVRVFAGNRLTAACRHVLMDTDPNAQEATLKGAAVDAAIRLVTAPTGADFGAEPDWTEVVKHRAVQVAVALAKSHDGTWYDGSNGAKQLTFAGRVYYQYGGHVMSYSAAARSRRVSNYQFRAPGEWFAELYATYQLGLLKRSHANYNWVVRRCA